MRHTYPLSDFFKGTCRAKRRFFMAMGTLAMLTFGAVGSSSQCSGQDKNSATFDADGTAHITRVIRPSATVSPEAQKWLKEIEHEEPQPKDLAELRAHTDAWQKSQSAEARRLYPANVAPVSSVSRPFRDPCNRSFTPDSNWPPKPPKATAAQALSWHKPPKLLGRLEGQGACGANTKPSRPAKYRR